VSSPCPALQRDSRQVEHNPDFRHAPFLDGNRDAPSQLPGNNKRKLMDDIEVSYLYRSVVNIASGRQKGCHQELLLHWHQRLLLMFNKP
jgi:hypothetical protein